MVHSKQGSTQLRTRRVAKSIAAECVGVRLRLLNRAMTRIYDEALRSHGIKFSQMNILTTIAMDGPVQPVEVARILSIEKSTLSRNVRILEANGWVERQFGDGNTHLLRVTPQGGQLLSKAKPAWKRAQKEVTTLMGPEMAGGLWGAVARVQNAEK